MKEIVVREVKILVVLLQMLRHLGKFLVSKSTLSTKVDTNKIGGGCAYLHGPFIQ